MGRALGHGTLLFCGWTVVGVALIHIHNLFAEVDTHHLTCGLSLATGHGTLEPHTHTHTQTDRQRHTHTIKTMNVEMNELLQG